MTSSVETQEAVISELSEATAADYFALLKPRVMSLVVFTAFVGLMAAPGVVNPVIGIVAILCIAVGAGAAGALNMWFDADVDALMMRTRGRPVPRGTIAPRDALAFGLILSALSIITLGLIVSWLTAAMLAFTIFFYVVIYTMWLKRRTPQNIVIGGAPGAFPPMIGWAAASGSISVESVLLFLIIFFWTPPHFWALALFKSGEYGRAGIPMMPNVAGATSTRRQIFVYALIVALVSVVPFVLRYTGEIYGAAATVLGAGFIISAASVLAAPQDDASMKAEKSLFAFSILYLFGIFAAYLADSIVSRAAIGL